MVQKEENTYFMCLFFNMESLTLQRNHQIASDEGVSLFRREIV